MMLHYQQIIQNILDNHLKEVVSDIEKKNDIDLIAIGIGHDVSKYYSKLLQLMM